MPILVDPEKELPDARKRPTASQIISWLLYPVILMIGVAIGIVIGVREAPDLKPVNNANRTFSNAKIVSNANTNRSNSNANTNTSNTNSNVLNTNIFRSGDAAKLDSTTETKLQNEKAAALAAMDRSVSFVDILRQQDLIDLEYSLKAYHAVRGEYPSTDGQPIRLERKNDTFYNSMKEFYGGSYYQKIDPESPKYYYGYQSDGTTYRLSAYLTSKGRPYYLPAESSE